MMLFRREPPGAAYIIEITRVHQFQPFCERLDFYEARKFCEGSGGYLVSIADAGEQEFVNGLLYGSLDIQESWIGYYRSKYRGPFEWVDKSPSTFEKWTVRDGSPKEPNNWGYYEACSVMELSGDWADLNCYAKKTFICERESCRDLPN
ncbi:hypothetical protein Y032_0517g2812 [Ancylostoma ceylanicum]|uniref:C-type lectin domain-containing protein n=1 Tax=Ancylostoma ceylanicum TaxID=53326 RepID=A0A016WSJ1_9BILA|nr:hypothetical protein Y032_0517g2812 [Ancylostoma ceylanicum]